MLPIKRETQHETTAVLSVSQFSRREIAKSGEPLYHSLTSTAVKTFSRDDRLSEGEGEEGGAIFQLRNCNYESGGRVTLCLVSESDFFTCSAAKRSPVPAEERLYRVVRVLEDKVLLTFDKAVPVIQLGCRVATIYKNSVGGTL